VFLLIDGHKRDALKCSRHGGKKCGVGQRQKSRARERKGASTTSDPRPWDGNKCSSSSSTRARMKQRKVTEQSAAARRFVSF
jgi:hypothetical protein